MRDSLFVGLALLYTASAVHAQTLQPKEELRLAIIVSRHGVRSPTWEPGRLNQYSTSPWPSFGVAPGELTPHGRDLMKIMGGFYREYYQSSGLLRKPGCEDSDSIFVRADNAQRTVVSAEALAEGILPGCKLSIHFLPADKKDALFDAVDAGVAKPDAKLSMAALAGRVGPKLDALVDAHRATLDALNRLLNGGGKAVKSVFDEPVTVTSGKTGANLNGPLNTASTLTEDLLLEYTDGMSGDRFGWGRLTEANLIDLMSLHTTYADLARRTPALARARGSNFLSYIVRSLEQAETGKPVAGAGGTPRTQLLVISGHDTNISNISGMLDLSWLLPSQQADDSVPGGAILFTLWRSPASGPSPDRYSVRVQFTAQTLDQMHNGTPLSVANPPAMTDVFVPGCSTSAKGFPCDWDAFRALAEASITPAFLEK